MLLKQMTFSYFAAVAFRWGGMVKPHLERILWAYPFSNKASLAKFCLVFQFRFVVLFTITLIMN